MKTTNKKIAGALFDFLGYLTILKNPITLSSKHDASLGLKCLQKWAKKRNFNLNDADVKNWEKNINLSEY